jgi:hypothetical protein
MANCNQPLADMSELLREEQGEGEVAQQQNGQNSATTVMMSICMGYLSFWQALT